MYVNEGKHLFRKVQFVLRKACASFAFICDSLYWMITIFMSHGIYILSYNPYTKKNNLYTCLGLYRLEVNTIMGQIHSAKDKCSHWVQKSETMWKCSTFVFIVTCTNGKLRNVRCFLQIGCHWSCDCRDVNHFFSRSSSETYILYQIILTSGLRGLEEICCCLIFCRFICGVVSARVCSVSDTSLTAHAEKHF